MGDHRLPKRVMSGDLENAGKRGPGGKEKEWTDCVWQMIFGGEGRRKCVQSTAEEERSGRGGQG